MNWAHYLLQVNIYLIVFYGFYKLFLDKETYFFLNRIYLISAGIGSLSIPFLRFEWFTHQPIAQPVYTSVENLSKFMTQVTLVPLTPEAPEEFSIGTYIVIFYLFGVACFTIKFIYQLFTVRKLLKRSSAGTAFSFFNSKVVDENLPGLDVIHKHEEIHIRQLHTLDVLFFEIISIITWFNPIIYLYKQTIKNLHEYLADDEAAKYQGNKKEYALLLLSTALGVPPNSLTNSFFNKSLVKKRIFMLHKQRSRKIAMLKYGLFIPLFAITLLLSSATIRKNENIQALADELPLEKPLTAVNDLVISLSSSTLKKVVISAKKKLVSIKQQDTDWTEFYGHLMTAVRYPESAKRKGIQGSSRVNFIIKNGQIENLSMANKLNAECDAAIMKAILGFAGYNTSLDGSYSIKVTFKLEGVDLPLKNDNLPSVAGVTALKDIVITGFPKHQSLGIDADQQDDIVIQGTPVPGTSQTPVTIIMRRAKPGETGLQQSSNLINELPASDDNSVYHYSSIETQPSFFGGMVAFFDYIQTSLRYPKEALENNIQGKVFLSFIIEKDGSLSDIKVDRKLGSGTDEEALRLMKESPRWIPGTYDGKRIRVKYNAPISFKLNTSSSNEPLKQKAFNISVTNASNPTNKFSFRLTPETADNTIYDFISIETQPGFPGGMTKFYSYVKNEMKYADNISGKVFLSFVVEKNGDITSIKVDRGLSPEADDEAVRLLKASPRWTPGIKNGKLVRVKYNIPISFNN